MFVGCRASWLAVDTGADLLPEIVEILEPDIPQTAPKSIKAKLLLPFLRKRDSLMKQHIYHKQRAFAKMIQKVYDVRVPESSDMMTLEQKIAFQRIALLDAIKKGKTKLLEAQQALHHTIVRGLMTTEQDDVARRHAMKMEEKEDKTSSRVSTVASAELVGVKKTQYKDLYMSEELFRDRKHDATFVVDQNFSTLLTLSKLPSMFRDQPVEHHSLVTRIVSDERTYFRIQPRFSLTAGYLGNLMARLSAEVDALPDTRRTYAQIVERVALHTAALLIQTKPCPCTHKDCVQVKARERYQKYLLAKTSTRLSSSSSPSSVTE